MQKSRALDDATSKSKQPDTPQNRKFLARKMANFIGGSIEVPPELRDRLEGSFDPVVASSHLIEDFSIRLVSFFLDFSVREGEEAETVFSREFKNILREFVGRLIEQLKPGFSGGLIDVLSLIRGNLHRKLAE